MPGGNGRSGGNSARTIDPTTWRVLGNDPAHEAYIPLGGERHRRIAEHVLAMSPDQMAQVAAEWLAENRPADPTLHAWLAGHADADPGD